MNEDFKIAVLCSGGGGNFQALIDAQTQVKFKICLLVVDNICGAIDRAIKNNIEYKLLDRKKIGREKFFAELDKILDTDNFDLIVLAGFMPIIPKEICIKWKGKIVNTHPSLLPKYGGKGMYGVKVQEAVMSAGEEYAGCTVHFVAEEIDAGEIIMQTKVKIDYSETPWVLGGRVHKEENKQLVDAVKFIRSNLMQLNKRGTDND